MTIIHMARVETISETVEEEVTLWIDGVRLVCFAAFCPYSIQVGGYYPVELLLFAIDDLEIKEVEAMDASIERVDDSFAHVLIGTLSGETLDAGLVFEDPTFGIDYAYLSGRTVQVRVDRIDAAFLPIGGPVEV
jgi:hypothetical protein